MNEKTKRQIRQELVTIATIFTLLPIFHYGMWLYNNIYSFTSSSACIPITVGMILRVYYMKKGMNWDEAHRKSVKAVIYGFLAFFLLLPFYSLYSIYETNNLHHSSIDPCADRLSEIAFAEELFHDNYERYTKDGLYRFVENSKFSSDEDVEKWVSKECYGSSPWTAWSYKDILINEKTDLVTVKGASKERPWVIMHIGADKNPPKAIFLSDKELYGTKIGKQRRRTGLFLTFISVLGFFAYIVWGIKDSKKIKLLESA